MGDGVYRDQVGRFTRTASMADATEKPDESPHGDAAQIDALAEVLRALKLYWTLPLNSSGEELRLERAARALVELLRHDRT
jgi:hypothetical protein